MLDCILDTVFDEWLQIFNIELRLAYLLECRPFLRLVVLDRFELKHLLRAFESLRLLHLAVEETLLRIRVLRKRLEKRLGLWSTAAVA